MKISSLCAILAISVLTIISNGANAQKTDDNIVGVGTTILNFGVGIGRSGYAYNGYNASGLGYGTGFGTKIAIERGMWQLGPAFLPSDWKAVALFQKPEAINQT